MTSTMFRHRTLLACLLAAPLLLGVAAACGSPGAGRLSLGTDVPTAGTVQVQPAAYVPPTVRPRPTPSTVSRPVPETAVISLVGDSVTATTYLPTGQRFLALLSSRVCGVWCGQPGHARLVDHLQGGLRIAGAAQQWPAILAEHPSTVLLAVGIDDMVLVPASQFEAQVKTLADQAAAAGVRFMPCTMAAVGAERADLQPELLTVNAWIMQTYGSTVCDLYTATRGPDGWVNPAYPLAGDTAHVHLDAAGVVAIADAVPLTRIG